MRYSSIILCVGLTLASVSPAWAVESGDSPPAPFYEATGQIDIVWAVEEFLGDDTFAITGIPGGATVEAAFFISETWDDTTAISNSIDLVFNGSAYGSVDADVMDYTEEEGGLDLAGYVVDVTADVSGDGSYPFTVTPNQSGNGAIGHLLVVVYEHETNPLNLIKMNVGAEAIRWASSTTEFLDIPGGDGELHIFTESDNGGGSEGEESIALNGSVILGGPDSGIFDSNQGCCTSYFELPVTLLEGYNTVTLTTGEDLFGWHFAALVVETTGSTATRSVSWGAVKNRFR